MTTSLDGGAQGRSIAGCHAFKGFKLPEFGTTSFTLDVMDKELHKSMLREWVQARITTNDNGKLDLDAVQAHDVKVPEGDSPETTKGCSYMDDRCQGRERCIC